MNFCSERFERLSLIGLFTEIQSGLEQESGLWCVIGRWQYCVCRRLRQLADSSSSAFANVLWLSAWLRALTERPSPHHKHRPYACSSGGMNNNRVKLLCTNAAGGRFNDFEASAPANWYNKLVNILNLLSLFGRLDYRRWGMRTLWGMVEEMEETLLSRLQCYIGTPRHFY